MSHDPATRGAATSNTRRAAQILRHTAVVGAGMASIGLTVAAGTYIANELPGAQRPDPVIAAPPAPPHPRGGTGTVPGLPDRPAITPIAEKIELTSLFGPLTDSPTQSAVTAARPSMLTSGQQPADAPGLAGRIRVGETFVGAQVVPDPRNSVAITVDTNVFGTVADLISPATRGDGIDLGPAGTTRLHTELDTRSGELTLTLSDTELGEVGVRLTRYPAPAAATAPESAAIPPDTANASASDEPDTALGRTGVPQQPVTAEASAPQPVAPLATQAERPRTPVAPEVGDLTTV
ncbi:hypothetical protein IU474_12470 [Nocardia otitidiscaviarum]|uniref:hypothetical protein n=1 Tax=Nocardia otitidiscaviarum TaxID=1823 RepID=UPI0018943750|nr:hypothetical protein [Nocardia otitidiscaviarum]MBF6237880.1 hypothetical protein [Nocardia otitidiscaviarum]